MYCAEILWAPVVPVGVANKLHGGQNSIDAVLV